MGIAYDKSNYKKGYWNLIAVLFQGAFSDNFFKYIMIFVLIDSAASDTAQNSGEIAAKAGMLFAIPYIIFPGIFGALSDRVNKKRIVVWTKYLEIIVMTVGFFAILNGAPLFLGIVYFMMATQSAVFGPAKYGILPEGLPEPRLSWGNGVMQMMTMIAIIAGVGCAGPVYQTLSKGGNVQYASIILVGLAVLGLSFSKPLSDFAKFLFVHRKSPTFYYYNVTHL